MIEPVRPSANYVRLAFFEINQKDAAWPRRLEDFVEPRRFRTAGVDLRPAFDKCSCTKCFINIDSAHAPAGRQGGDRFCLVRVEMSCEKSVRKLVIDLAAFC